jgi:BirA family transcriptional regulator, biotin operon repressor / biotin---[acetyl-CoA-carboxylase] ligase
VSYNAALFRALASGTPVSGETLGRQLGISRSAVWKAVRKLSALGVEVEALPGQGYRLAQPVDLLDAARIRAGLPADIAARLGHLEALAATDSSNARVLESEQPVGELVACLAEYQTAGRGRRGRGWLAPPGTGLCLSVGGRLASAPSDFAVLAPAVGVACAEVLESFGLQGVGLKWPNDLLKDGRKLGGILIEMRGEAQGPAVVAVGLGLNFRLSDSIREAITAAGGLPPATLEEVMEGRTPERNVVAAALIVAVVRCLDEAPAGLGQAALNGWRRRDALHGKSVRITGFGAEQIGIARGVDRAGALLVEDQDGQLRRITAGEATLRPQE